MFTRKTSHEKTPTNFVAQAEFNTWQSTLFTIDRLVKILLYSTHSTRLCTSCSVSTSNFPRHHLFLCLSSIMWFVASLWSRLQLVFMPQALHFRKRRRDHRFRRFTGCRRFNKRLTALELCQARLRKKTTGRKGNIHNHVSNLKICKTIVQKRGHKKHVFVSFSLCLIVSYCLTFLHTEYILWSLGWNRPYGPAQDVMIFVEDHCASLQHSWNPWNQHARSWLIITTTKLRRPKL